MESPKAPQPQSMPTPPPQPESSGETEARKLRTLASRLGWAFTIGWPLVLIIGYYLIYTPIARLAATSEEQGKQLAKLESVPENVKQLDDYVTEQLDGLKKSISDVSQKLAGLESLPDNVKAQMASMETRLGVVTDKLNDTVTEVKRLGSTLTSTTTELKAFSNVPEQVKSLDEAIKGLSAQSKETISRFDGIEQRIGPKLTDIRSVEITFRLDKPVDARSDLALYRYSERLPDVFRDERSNYSARDSRLHWEGERVFAEVTVRPVIRDRTLYIEVSGGEGLSEFRKLTERMKIYVSVTVWNW